jgi:hypothetical protein
MYVWMYDKVPNRLALPTGVNESQAYTGKCWRQCRSETVNCRAQPLISRVRRAPTQPSMCACCREPYGAYTYFIVAYSNHVWLFIQGVWYILFQAVTNPCQKVYIYMICLSQFIKNTKFFFLLYGEI